MKVWYKRFSIFAIIVKHYILLGNLYENLKQNQSCFPCFRYVLAAYILVSFTLFVMARFSPYEWNNPHPCDTENDVMENQFSISNSFWFITGTFLRQVLYSD